ncbi:FkbM family methyltransferase [Pleurocapsa sp. PCC 7319]|uniref:FkbM family methyltransferase n=1 Tax=Pleurocapsa sp. PCC 7319 TaxID=118161 RepID=UPI001ED9AE00|nr:FkbM family methyltransferase [Pleurocapsa sp. PCC 7319]
MNYNRKINGENLFLQKLLGSSDKYLVIDVGANVGEYSNKVKSISKSVTIYAFEPHPITFKKLQAAASKYNYIAVNLGCSNIQGDSKLFDYQENCDGSTHASLYKNVIEKFHSSSSVYWDIKLTTIDHFVDKNNIRKINLLKIDTEGNELNVLIGAKKSIEEKVIDIIHFEFNKMNITSRVFFKDFYEQLPEYSFYRMLPDGLVKLEAYNPLFCEIFAYQNIVAIHKEYDQPFSS